MPTFIYKAKRGLKETIGGTIEAANRDAAAIKLSDVGLIPVSIELKAEVKGAALAQKPLRPRKIGLRELNIFTQQLKTLIRAKVELLSCLNILYKQTDNASLRQIILDLHNTVKDGKTFSEGLGKYPNFFPLLYVNIIRAGETSGRLDESLSQLSEFLAKEQDLRMKVATALAYPAMMVVVGIGTIFVLFSFVIPRLIGIFDDFQVVLPLPTRILLGVSNFMQAGWPWVIGFIVLLGFGLRQQKIAAVRNAIEILKNRLPIFGELLRKQGLARFAHTLALLLHSGIPLHQALGIAIPTLESRVFIRQLEAAHKEVLAGVSLANSMKKAAFIPPFIIQMLTVGEEGGRLEEVLLEIADAYTQESETILKIITALIEPLVILCLGLVLGLIIMGILLPIFQINMLIR